MRRTESAIGAGGLLDMSRTESAIGAGGLLDILYSTCPPTGDEPLLDALGDENVSHERSSSDEQAVQHRDASEAPAAKAQRVASMEVGRGSVDMVLPPAGTSFGSASAEAQARVPTALPVSLHSPLLSWPSARAPAPIIPSATTTAAAHLHEAEAGCERRERPTSSAWSSGARGACPGAFSPELSPSMLYAMAADVELPPFALPPPETPEHPLPLAMPHPMPLGSAPLHANRQTALGELLESQAAPSTGWRPSPRSQPPAEFAEACLYEHARWQEALRSALAHADGYTRSLVGAATAYSPCGTMGVLARLSPRQINSLHPPARALVQRLLDVTRAHASLDHTSLDPPRPPLTSLELPRLSPLDSQSPLDSRAAA